jgi:hypothetical protein
VGCRIRDRGGRGPACRWGWLSGKTIACFVVSIASAVAFVMVEKRRSAPLLDLRLLRNKLLVGTTLVGFAVLAFVQDSWKYSAFVLPLIALAAGMSLQNGPSSSISTASVEPKDVGAASGISNMARYVGAAVMTAIVASIYATVSANRTGAGEPLEVALAAAVSRTAIAMGIWCALGIGLALLAGRHRPGRPGRMEYAAAAASTSHTLHLK